MSGFSISWLDLRENADVAARDKELAKKALDWLGQQQDALTPDRIIVDLGSGTGSTIRALNRLGAHNIVWRLVDYDGQLLDEALRRHGKTNLIEDYQADLRIIDELPLTGAHLITASALFDLASMNFIDDLIARLARNRTAIYAALNYDGTTQWVPEHPLDAEVLAAFNQDQHQDKGFGPALGPDATGYLQHALEHANFHVVVRSSPWLLGPQDQALTTELINGIASAVAENYGVDAVALQDWTTFRLANTATGSCVIGHQDILALP